MRKWKAWEMETKTSEYQYAHGRFSSLENNAKYLMITGASFSENTSSTLDEHIAIYLHFFSFYNKKWIWLSVADPERYRFARDTSFGRRHLSFWSRSSFLLWLVRPNKDSIVSFHITQTTRHFTNLINNLISNSRKWVWDVNRNWQL